jgi:hypothetical protein
MSADMGLGRTGQSLVDATYRALGYRRTKYPSWVLPATQHRNAGAA